MAPCRNWYLFITFKFPYLQADHARNGKYLEFQNEKKLHRDHQRHNVQWRLQQLQGPLPHWPCFDLGNVFFGDSFKEVRGIYKIILFKISNSSYFQSVTHKTTVRLFCLKLRLRIHCVHNIAFIYQFQEPIKYIRIQSCLLQRIPVEYP